MELSIDTRNSEHVTLTLSKGQKSATHVFKTDRNLSEQLILQIQKFLAKQKVKFSQLSKIEAAMGEGHFSRIRTAVATANALAYALKLKQKIIQPVYDKLPNISLSKRNLSSSRSSIR